MRWATMQLLLWLGLSLSVEGQSGSNHLPASPSTPTPLYTISFQKGDAVPGVGAVPAMRLPFECTSDGTIFISILQPLGISPPQPNLAPFSPSLLLTSISPSREAHSYPLDQVPDLYDLREVEHYASESQVLFLLEAARENKITKQEYVTSDSAKHEFTGNSAERHFYIVSFDREGKYEKTVQIGDDFSILQIGVFPSGMYLVYGYDKIDRSPKLSMLKDDGTLLKYIQIPKSGAPAVAFGTLHGSGKGAANYIEHVQFQPNGHSILVVHNKTDLPVLEVSEGGAIKVLHTRLPEGVQINMLIPSDENLYARVGQIHDGSIYELDAQHGTVLKRFQVGADQSGADVACVHEGKFLSFERFGDTMVPLVGTAEPEAEIKSGSPRR